MEGLTHIVSFYLAHGKKAGFKREISDEGLDVAEKLMGILIESGYIVINEKQKPNEQN
jgi:hypothetical protein